MGKKSRRSNRKGHSKGDGRKGDRLEQLQREANESYQNRLYPEAVRKYQEGIEIMQEAQKVMLKKTGFVDPILLKVLQMKAVFCQNLMLVEYSRCSFDKVIPIYNDLQMLPENEKVLLSFRYKVQGRHAMLRLDSSSENKDQLISLINDRISEGMKGYNDYDEMFSWFSFLETVRLLRNLKYYDEAITLGEKLEKLDENGVGAKFENAASHLERYLSEYHRQTDSRYPNNVLVRVQDVCNEFENRNVKADGVRRDSYLIMIAQRDYLCHQVDDRDLSSQLCDSAIKHVEKYLETIRHFFDGHCFTCNQKGTATEVQLVCSGCRVACYCSLDHQRMTWKKEAVQGMRIGHEILCPLWKAYRKWKPASKKSNGNALKLRRRFESECLYFLSHGLGLKDKCFMEEDVQKILSS